MGLVKYLSQISNLGHLYGVANKKRVYLKKATRKKYFSTRKKNFQLAIFTF